MTSPAPNRDLISSPSPTKRPPPIGTPSSSPPKVRSPERLGITFKDGWNFGLGFWLTGAVIIGGFSCLIALGLAVLSGGLLGGLL